MRLLAVRLRVDEVDRSHGAVAEARGVPLAQGLLDIRPRLGIVLFPHGQEVLQLPLLGPTIELGRALLRLVGVDLPGARALHVPAVARSRRAPADAEVAPGDADRV